jgi:hypothetical protein
MLMRTIAVIIVVAGAVGYALAMELSKAASGVPLKILLFGIGFALPAYCGITAARLIRKRKQQGNKGS